MSCHLTRMRQVSLTDCRPLVSVKLPLYKDQHLVTVHCSAMKIKHISDHRRYPFISILSFAALQDNNAEIKQPPAPPIVVQYAHDIVQ